MNEKQTGGPAFGAHPESANWHPSWQGMTLRDYFAAKALHYCLKNCFTREGAAIDAYDIADAMLKAREQ